MQNLKFYARGNAMVFDLESHEGGTRKFVGRKHDATIGTPGVDEYGNKFMSGGWPSTGAAQEVPYRAEYVKACKDGDLWPADQETAATCGVQYDAHLGGEYASLGYAEAQHAEGAQYQKFQTYPPKVTKSVAPKAE